MGSLDDVGGSDFIVGKHSITIYNSNTQVIVHLHKYQSEFCGLGGLCGHPLLPPSLWAQKWFKIISFDEWL